MKPSRYFERSCRTPTGRPTESVTLSIPWQKPTIKVIPEDPDAAGALREDIRPDRAERRLRLISAVAQGRRWLDEIVSGSITDAEQLAKRERCTERQNQSHALARVPCSAVGQRSRRRTPRQPRRRPEKVGGAFYAWRCGVVPGISNPWSLARSLCFCGLFCYLRFWDNE